MQFWTADIEKQIGARVQIVLETPELLAAYQRFGAEILRRSSVFHGLEKFLRAQNIRGERAFEVGTWNGLTAVVLSKFFREVVTVDIAHRAEKHEVLRHLGITNVVCIDVADNAEKLRVAKGLQFDFAYIDGDHANDTEADWMMTRRCRRVLFHECWPWQAPVWDLVRALPPGEVVENGEGLALWRRGA